MKGKQCFGLLAAVVLVAGVAFAADKTKVELSKMHLCCGGCVKGVKKAAGTVDGVTCSIDKKGGKATLAGDKASLEKALAAIAKAGYHGTSCCDIKMKDDSGAPDGKVAKLVLDGLHNCCGGCARKAIAAAKSVDGVTGVDLPKKSGTITVSGDFNAKAVVKALNDAGYHGKVKK